MSIPHVKITANGYSLPFSFLIAEMINNAIPPTTQEMIRANIILYPPKIKPPKATNSTSPNPIPSLFLINLYIDVFFQKERKEEQ